MKRFAAGLVLAALAAAPAFAQKTVTFAHQDMIVPLRTVMESGELEKATGYKINWRMFGGGGDVIKAMASGDVQLGEAGSSRRSPPRRARARTSSCSGSSTTSRPPRR